MTPKDFGRMTGLLKSAELSDFWRVTIPSLGIGGFYLLYRLLNRRQQSQGRFDPSVLDMSRYRHTGFPLPQTNYIIMDPEYFRDRAFRDPFADRIRQYKQRKLERRVRELEGRMKEPVSAPEPVSDVEPETITV